MVRIAALVTGSRLGRSVLVNHQRGSGCPVYLSSRFALRLVSDDPVTERQPR
jgi:hypothetical protein